MIKTTVYSDGIVSTGYYYDSRGVKTTVDYVGNEEDYSDMMLDLRLHNDDITEVRHLVNHRINARYHAPVQINPLMTAWHNPV